MKAKTSDRVNLLIKKLKVNDKKDLEEYEETPDEPKEAMDELSAIGDPAVDSLLQLLKSHSKFSCQYAIEILGNIRNPRATRPILEVLTSEQCSGLFQLSIDYDQAILAIQKIGSPALEQTLEFLKEKISSNDETAAHQICKILVGIKDDRSFFALADMLSNGVINRDDAINFLGEYGDKRAVDYLKKILADDQEERILALKFIRKWVSLKEYQNIIAPYVVKDIEDYKGKIQRSLGELTRAHIYKPNFEGDSAEEFSFISLEHKIQNSLSDILENVYELGQYEAAYPDDFDDFINKKAEIYQNWLKYEEEHSEELELAVNNCYPEDVISKMTKAFKGLAQSKYESGPKIEELLKRLIEWLKAQSFSVTKDGSSFWAMKGLKGSRQGCFVSSGSDDDLARTWGRLHLGVWGSGWTDEDAKEFSDKFWEFSETTIKELTGKNKLEIKIIKEE